MTGFRARFLARLVGRLPHSLAASVARQAMSRLPGPEREAVIAEAMAAWADAPDPAEALRALFRLDSVAYGLEGRLSVRYGGGTHTKHRHTRYHDFFVQRIAAGSRVLDVGCGDGTLSRDIAERAGAQVLGVEIRPEAIAVAEARNAHPRVTYRVLDVRHGLPDGPFDVVTLSNVLEHLPGRPGFLAGLAEASRAPHLLVRVPQFEREWRVPLRRELGVEWRLDATHETEYTHEQFAAETAEAGLKIAHCEVRWGEIWAELVRGRA